MQKIDVPRLLQRILSEPLPRGKALGVVSDDGVFARVLHDRLTLEAKKAGASRASVFSGKAPAQEFLDHASQGGMFAEPEPCLVRWTEKLAAKPWEAEAAFLKRLPTPLPLPCAFLFPLSAREIVKKPAFSWLEMHLCWPAPEAEALRAAGVLLGRFPKLAAASAPAKQTWVAQAMEYYSGDLSNVDAHFHRMNETGLPFEEAFAGAGDVSAFEVVEALARGDAELVHLRTKQCHEAGENPGAVLMAVAGFLRQLGRMHGALEAQGSRKDPRAAFDALAVPYPQQARLQKALSSLAPRTVARFFLEAGPLEATLRTHRDPFGLLAVELSSLVVRR